MTTHDDELLRALLKTALPPAHPGPPSRDVWPRVVACTSAAPKWTLADWSAAAVVIGALLLFPKWFWFLAYHL